MKNSHVKTQTNHFLLWFGAAISIAEILTGALIAPLGLTKGILAILTGHLIGGLIFYYTGYIGAKSKLSAIETTKAAFGQYGTALFSILNILQLLGWTAVMIANGALAINQVTGSMMGYTNFPMWCGLIALLIGLWIVVGVKNLHKINLVAVGALFFLCVILGFIAFNKPLGLPLNPDHMRFGMAVELAIIMPLSWLPLISDYTRHAVKEKQESFISAFGYFIGSCFMYIIGLGATLTTGTSDIATLLSLSDSSSQKGIILGVVALMIIILSTVTTTFLDAFSAGVSAVSLHPKIDEKKAGLLMTALGFLMAVFIPTSQYENFLYLIGSVFAPLFAIVLVNFYVLKKETTSSLNIPNLIIWMMGVIAYRLLMMSSTPIGITVPIMMGTGLLCYVANFLRIKLFSQEDYL